MNRTQPELERIHFKIGLSGTYWDKKPQYEILINDKKFFDGIIQSPQEVTDFFEFSVELEEDKTHYLQIRLVNKSDSDVVKDRNDKDNFNIIKDMLLNIDSIQIEDIDISHLMWTESKFVGDDPERPVLKNCVNLGWNGTYILEFTTPFYLWLLEKM